jgi:glucokinase
LGILAAIFKEQAFMDKVYLTVDLGGTRIRAARCRADGTIEARTEQFTRAEDGAHAVVERIAESLREVWPAKGKVISIGVVAPGPVDPFTGVIFLAPNIPGFVNLPLRDWLQAIFKVPVIIGNDANLAGLAEWRYGAARGHGHMVYLTVSTGIGGGVIMNGHLLVGSRGLAGELGHVKVDYHGSPCQCGSVGCIEAIASGTGLVRQVRARLDAGEQSQITAIVADDLDAINVEAIARAAEQGDALANAVLDDAFYALGMAVVSFLHCYNPSIVVIGGGVSNLGERMFNPVRATVERHVMDPAYVCPIVPAQLSGDVGLLGALALALDPPPQSNS